MKHKIINAATALLFIAGFGFVFYPSVSSYLSNQETNLIIKEFNELTEEVTEEHTEAFDEEFVEEPATEFYAESADEFQKLYEDMQAYNEKIYEDGQANLQDPFIFETPAFDLIGYGFKSNVTGYLSIPKMDVELAIYFGATKENMANGAVSLGYTSTPIGGINTNTVLAAHRGYKGIAMFRDIEGLEIGDKLYITNFWQKLTYEVVETRIITPTDIDEIRIQEGRDLLTLITCHPYTKNYQRYVVYCERVVTDEGEYDSETVNTKLGIEYLFKLDEISESQRLIFAEKWIPRGVAVVLLILILFKIIIWIRKNREMVSR